MKVSEKKKEGRKQGEERSKQPVASYARVPEAESESSLAVQKFTESTLSMQTSQRIRSCDTLAHDKHCATNISHSTLWEVFGNLLSCKADDVPIAAV